MQAKLSTHSQNIYYFMQHTHPDALPFLNFLPDTDATLFLKYSQGKSLPNAPFKLVPPSHSCSSTEEQCSSLSRRPRARGPYRRYSPAEKQEAVRCIERGQDVTTVARRYNIPRRNLLRWQQYGCERREGSGRAGDSLIERALVDKIKLGELTDETQLREQAIMLCRSLGTSVSKCWLAAFSHRNGLGEQQRSSKHSPCQFESTDCLPK